MKMVICARIVIYLFIYFLSYAITTGQDFRVTTLNFLIAID